MYFFDTDDNGFGSCWLVKKNLSYPGSEEDSVWDASHVVKTTMEAGQKAKYKVTSTVFLTLNTKNEAQGQLDMAGNVTRFKEDLIQLDPKQNESQQHLKTIGRMIEQNESEIRQEMNGIFINKSKQIINTGRLRDEYMTIDEKGAFQQELFAAMAKNK